MFGRITNYQGARHPAPLPPQRNDEHVEEDDDDDEAAALLLRPDESDSDSVSPPGSALSDDNDDAAEGPLHIGSRRAAPLAAAGETPSARNPQDVDHHAAAAFQLSSLLQDVDDDNESPSVVSNGNANNNNISSPALISTSTHSLRSRTTKDSIPMVHTTTTTTTSRKSPLRSALPLRRRLGCDEADTEDNDDDNDTHDYMDYDSSCCDDEFIMEARKQPMALRHNNTATTAAINNHRLHRWHIFGIPLCCCSLNRMAAFVLWSTIISLAVAVVWYSYELFNHGCVCVCVCLPVKGRTERVCMSVSFG